MPKVQTLKVTCDTCERDITWTTNCEDWRIAVKNESVPPKGNTLTLAARYPHLENDLYFCSHSCLSSYFEPRG